MSEDPLSDCQEYAAELESRAQWISVAERLPSKGKRVLAYVSKDDKRRAVYIMHLRLLRGGDGPLWKDDDDDSGSYFPPTHWMPIPPAPEAK